jgi:hypothetical protein
MREVRMRRHVLRLFVGMLLAVLLMGSVVSTRSAPLGIGPQRADATPAPAITVAGPRPALVQAVVPNWLKNYLLKKVGRAVGEQILKQMGYLCPNGGSPFNCYTDYDPPRWAAGTVDTGGPAYWVNARAWPALNAPVVRTFRHGWRLVIFCQTRGAWVYGRWGWTNVWNYVGNQGEHPRFVSDGYVNTGSNGFVAGDCASTNYGG